MWQADTANQALHEELVKHWTKLGMNTWVKLFYLAPHLACCSLRAALNMAASQWVNVRVEGRGEITSQVCSDTLSQIKPPQKTSQSCSLNSIHRSIKLILPWVIHQSVLHLLTISTCRGSKLGGAEAGTANCIFFLSLGSVSTSVGTEASIALDPEESDCQWKREVTAKDHFNLPGGTSHCWVVPIQKTCPLPPVLLFHKLNSLGKITNWTHFLSLFSLPAPFPFPAVDNILFYLSCFPSFSLPSQPVQLEWMR